MADDYTPTTDEVRQIATSSYGRLTWDEFGRWLAQHDAEVRATAQTAQPSVEDVARVLAGREWERDARDSDLWADLADQEQTTVIENLGSVATARVVLALLPGTPAAQIRAEALRDAAVELFGDVTAERGTTKAMNHAIYATWLLGRADEEAES